MVLGVIGLFVLAIPAMGVVLVLDRPQAADCKE